MAVSYNKIRDCHCCHGAQYGAQISRLAQKLLDVQRILELAQRTHSLYLTRKSAEQADLLRKVLLNCTIDGASITPAYRKPFDGIFNRAKGK